MLTPPKLGDLESSFTPAEIESGLKALETPADLLSCEARNLETLDLSDESSEGVDRALDSLLEEASRATGRARAIWLARAADFSHRKMGNLARAVELYIDAFDFAPGDETLIMVAEPIFDQMGRGRELTKLLREQADEATDKVCATFLHSKVAARCTADSDFEGAIAAYQALLAIEIGVDALRALVSLLEQRQGREAQLAQALSALAEKVDAEEARALRRRRIALLAFNLYDLEGAKQELRTLVSDPGAQDLLVLELFAKLALETADPVCEAEARERQLKLPAADADRIAWARALADLYEGVLASPSQAIAALRTWASFDRANTVPYLRLVPLLEQAKEPEALRSTLDVLSTLSSDRGAASEALLRAARISMDELADYEGAWQRLLPRVLAGDGAAEDLLRELARIAGRGEQLAELFVGFAQRSVDTNTQIRRWMDAAYAYEVLVGAVDKALEAMLRAFAKDMSNLSVLDEVDRLSALAQAWPRLAQVYEALARHHDTVEARTATLLRHASLLEHKANDLSQAFDRAALAFSLDPKASHVYAEACRLGQAGARIQDLIAVHDLRASAASEPNQKIDALIEAARLAQTGAEGVLPAAVYLTRAVVQAANDETLIEHVEQLVKKTDDQQTHARSELVRTLCEVYLLCGEEEQAEPELASELLRRAATLLEREEQDLDEAYAALARAVTLSPTDATLLDGLVSLCTRAGKLDALAVHLKQLADDAIDADTASITLERLLALYEGALAAPDKAAEVCAKLSILKPYDIAVADKHRVYLERAGNLTELLVAIERQLALVSTPEAQRPLLEQAAQIWEVELHNRFEAHAIWTRVMSLYPDDWHAAQALERLGARVSVHERELLDDDLVVGPEDLRPSSVPQAPFLEQAHPDACRLDPDTPRSGS